MTEKSIVTITKEYQKARKNYTDAITGYINNASALSDGEFWRLTSRLRNKLSTAISSAGGPYAVNPREVITNWVMSDSQLADNDYLFPYVARYVRTYFLKCSEILPVLDPLTMKAHSHSDDGFDDLVDSFPLAGEEVFSLAKTAGSFEELNKMVMNQFGSEMHTFIIHGENYIKTALHDALVTLGSSTYLGGMSPDSWDIPPMKEYRVRWEIDITASSPEDAAKQCREIQQDPDNMAYTFDVYNEDGSVKVATVEVTND